LKPSKAWRESWWKTGVHEIANIVWRGVEAQHVGATMRLVDTLSEQEALEQILEASKPPLAAGSEGQHYMLFTPFRYCSPHPSRFRAAGALGIWYGAEELHTACAEVAYWRWRFLTDSDGLADGELLSEHTLFQARASGAAIDLTGPPWVVFATSWMHPSDYAACQAVAVTARERGDVQWIRYTSARRDGGHCAAALTPECLKLRQPFRQQTWVCKVTRKAALMGHGSDRLSLSF
jgi:hypothetical protein